MVRHDLKAAGPLMGVRIIDFTWHTAGPTATRVLADMGAEVIKIESPGGERTRERDLADNIPGINRGGHFNNVNRGKLSITLDMSRPEAIEMVLRLIRISDVVADNFRSGVMARWGLGYERLRELRPDLIMLEMAGFGQTGPYRDLPSYGPTLQTLTAFTYLTAYNQDEPMGIGFAYADLMSGLTGALAVLHALVHRSKTGEGQYIDLSQHEATASLLSHVVLDWSANGRLARPSGARSPFSPAAPHGIYPCKDEDRWIAIAVFDEKDWQSFLGVLDDTILATDPRFQTQLGRAKHSDALDELVATATKGWECYELMHRLQEAGVAAGVVQNGEDLVTRDAQLQARGFYTPTDHPEIGHFLVQGSPLRLSETPVCVRHGAPTLGQHRNYVHRELLGMTPEEIASHLERGVF